MENKPRKLKMLCIHGYNNNAEVLRDMLKDVIKLFDPVMEFTFVDGPHLCLDPPIPALLKKGFKPPFYSNIDPMGWKSSDPD